MGNNVEKLNIGPGVAGQGRQYAKSWLLAVLWNRIMAGGELSQLADHGRQGHPFNACLGTMPKSITIEWPH